ncbi:hypothetical protein [Ferrimonas pelagia]|uniref:Uncharacterized protein n=1 Tax=Ferrimonas pelagia TaxID=1177826 RepID=A0ABP9F897_9GAMM
MSVIAVENVFTVEQKPHHKPRHLKKFAIGPFAQTCVEFRFEGDIEKFDGVDDALTELQNEHGWDLFIAYFNNRYHVAVNFFTEQEAQDKVIELVQGVVTTALGAQPDFTVLAGDANYGDWDSSYAE